MAVAKFYKCVHCGNIMYPVYDTYSIPLCCGDKMVQVDPGAVDASKEKHVPVITNDPDGKQVTITVGSEAHPMEGEHYIQFVAITDKDWIQIKKMTPKDGPSATFIVDDNKAPYAAYAYCNLHGLWRASNK